MILIHNNANEFFYSRAIIISCLIVKIIPNSTLLLYRLLTSFVPISKFISAFLIAYKYVCPSNSPLNCFSHLTDSHIN